MKKNRIIRSVMMLLFMTALVFGWTALLHADGNLMHNSDRFGECSNSAYDGTSQAECEGAGGTWTSTSQWSGNWGLSGGKYGAITCETCHVDTDTNIKMIRISISAPNGTDEFPGEQAAATINFQDPTSDFGDPGTASGYVCEYCHSTTSVHKYNIVANHNGQVECVYCHKHDGGFKAGMGGPCSGCHSDLVSAMAASANTTYHHLVSSDEETYASGTANETCNQCHAKHSDFGSGGAAYNLRPFVTDAGGANTGVNTDWTIANSGGLCLSCHFEDRADRWSQPDNTPVNPHIDPQWYETSAHNYTVPSTFNDGSTFNANCLKCHNDTMNPKSSKDVQTGTNKFGVHQSTLEHEQAALGISSPVNPLEEKFCFRCHAKVTDTAVTNKPAANMDWYNVKAMSTHSEMIYTEFQKTYTHPISDAAMHGKHSPGENSGANFSGSNKHVECQDCHVTHGATVDSPIRGVYGVDPTNSSTPGAAPTSYANVEVTDLNLFYKVCFKCHSDWGGAASGKNIAQSMNVNNDSFHWIENDKGSGPKASTTYGNFNHNTISGGANDGKEYVDIMMIRYGSYNDSQLRQVGMRCTDCHGTDGADGNQNVPEGLHGSELPFMLKVPAGSPYTLWSPTTQYVDGNVWCFNCHDPNFTNTGFYGESSNLHTKPGLHANKRPCQDCHIATAHGSEGVGSANQRKRLLKSSTFSEGIDSQTSGNHSESGGHNTVLIGCT